MSTNFYTFQYTLNTRHHESGAYFGQLLLKKKRLFFLKLGSIVLCRGFVCNIVSVRNKSKAIKGKLHQITGVYMQMDQYISCPASMNEITPCI